MCVRPKNVNKSLLRDKHPDRTLRPARAKNSAGLSFEIAKKANVFAATESTVLIKQPNAVNLVHKAGNASKMSVGIYTWYVIDFRAH